LLNNTFGPVVTLLRPKKRANKNNNKIQKSFIHVTIGYLASLQGVKELRILKFKK
jgi:hypothetical protein